MSTSFRTKPTGTYQDATTALRAEKERFGSTRRARWFGLKS
jgi:sulfide:quinone oxidoreductase